MKFENVNALYCDPNAYIKPQHKKEKETKKVVFQEPYETLPNFYLNNGFKKHACECVKNKKEECKPPSCDCSNKKNNNNFGFDLKSLLPFISGLGKGGGIGDIVKLLGNSNSNQGGGSGIDVAKILSSLFSGENGLNLKNLFGGSKKQEAKNKLKSTDFEIKNYKRVE